MLEPLSDLVEGRWRSVFRNTLDAILLIDDEGCLVEANPAACRLLGYSREELLELNVFAIAPAENLAQTVALWQTFIADGTSQQEHVVRCQDGTKLDVEYKAVANVLPGVHLSVFHDITDRKRAERQSACYARRLEAIVDIDGAILAAHSSGEIARAVASQVHRLVQCKLACTFIFDEDAETMSAYPTNTRTERLLSLGTHCSITWLGDVADLRQGRTRLVEDISSVSNPSPLGEMLRQEGVRSYAAIPVLSDNDLVAVLLVGFEQPAEVMPDRLALAVPIAQRVAVALRGARLLEEVLRGRQRLKQLSRQLLRTQETERRHIARELHDVIGQALAVTKVNLEILELTLPSHPSNDLLHETVSMIEEALEQARNLSLDLRPSLLDDMGLACAAGAHLERQSRRLGFAAEYTVELLFGRFAAEIETGCFRVLQEAVTNIVRHANASKICVGLRTVDGNLEMTIRDDGSGFDLAIAQQRALRGESLGLLGMQERVGLLGGTIKIHSAPGQGTTIRVLFPASDPHGLADGPAS